MLEAKAFLPDTSTGRAGGFPCAKKRAFTPYSTGMAIKAIKATDQVPV